LRLRNRYFGLRHGESEANERSIIISDPGRGVAHWGLTARGRAQVEAAVRGCPQLGPSTLIYASDFLRARETAEVARAVLGATAVRLRTALRERWFGEHEGGPNSIYGGLWKRDAVDPDHHDHGVESAREVQERMWALVQELEDELHDQTVLLVSHGDPLQLLGVRFLDCGPETHRDLPPWQPGEVRAL
jgi:broad specificity phosphatase PhoE